MNIYIYFWQCCGEWGLILSDFQLTPNTVHSEALEVGTFILTFEFVGDTIQSIIIPSAWSVLCYQASPKCGYDDDDDLTRV